MTAGMTEDTATVQPANAPATSPAPSATSAATTIGACNRHAIHTTKGIDA